MTVLVDPQPLVAQVPASVLDGVLRRADWWSCSEAEATATTGITDPVAAARALAARSDRAHVLVRTGAAGCLLLDGGCEPQQVPAHRVAAIDSNGAGDAHVGVFLATLVGGASAPKSADRANAAAALATTRLGPATAPTRAELDRFMAPRSAPAPKA